MLHWILNLSTYACTRTISICVFGCGIIDTSFGNFRNNFERTLTDAHISISLFFMLIQRCFPVAKFAKTHACPNCNKPAVNLVVFPVSPTKIKSRSGRWTIQEITVVDELCRFFETGNLPLPSSVKLSDVLSQFLSCKSSRLTKKLRMGNLSQLYVRKEGYLSKDSSSNEPYEFSSILAAFLSFLPSLAPSVESVWRQNFFNLCLELKVPVANAAEFLGSVERRSGNHIADSFKMQMTEQMVAQSVAVAAAVSEKLRTSTPRVESNVLTESDAADEEYLDVLLRDLDDGNNEIEKSKEEADATVTDNDDESTSTRATGAGTNLSELSHFNFGGGSATDFEGTSFSNCGSKRDFGTSGQGNNDASDLCNLLGAYMPLEFNNQLSQGYTLLRLSLLRHFNGIGGVKNQHESDVLNVILCSYKQYRSQGQLSDENIANFLVQEYQLLMWNSRQTLAQIAQSSGPPSKKARTETELSKTLEVSSVTPITSSHPFPARQVSTMDFCNEHIPTKAVQLSP